MKLWFRFTIGLQPRKKWKFLACGGRLFGSYSWFELRCKSFFIAGSIFSPKKEDEEIK